MILPPGSGRRAGRPVAAPGTVSDGLSVTAAAERAEAAFVAAREVLPEPRFIACAGQLAAILAVMPPEMPVIVNEVTRIAPDAIGTPGVQGTVLRLVTASCEPALPVRGSDGREYDVVEPAIELGACVVADRDDTVPEVSAVHEWPILRRHHRIGAALEAGHLGEYLLLTGQSLKSVARTLDSVIHDRCPRDRDILELAGVATRLRAVAATLLRRASSADDPTAD